MPKRTSSSPKRRSNKRAKTESRDLPIDALGIVVQFLAPRELYHIAFTCKGMLQYITVELVVRSALLHGGSPRKTVEALYPLMQNKSIHPVSAVRLLRLVNCRRCEYCKRGSMRTIRPDYGVALCFQGCLVKQGFAAKTGFIRGLKNFPRIASGEERRGWHYMWNRPLEQGGEACGPLATWNEIRDPRIGGSVNPTRVQQALQDAPPPQAYQAFVQTYEGHATAAVTAQEERQERTQRKEEAKKQKFRERVVKMIEKVKRGVDSSQRDLVMSFRTPTEEDRRQKPVPVFVFNCPAVHALMRHYVHFPRECGATEAREIAENINGYLETIEVSQCLTFSFLSEADPFENKLKQYCQAKYPDLGSLVRDTRSDQAFFRLLEEGRCFEAMIRSFFAGGKTFMSTFIVQFCGIPQSQALLALKVWQQEREAHENEQDSRKKLGRVYVAFMTAFPKGVESVSEYCQWLHANDEQADTSQARTNALGDPACFEYLRKKDFEGLRAYERNPNHRKGVALREDDLLRVSVGFADLFPPKYADPSKLRKLS
jgi:hypothetical protein